MDRMFNFIPEEGKSNNRYDIFFNSDKEPIILIDTKYNDITFSELHIGTVMRIMGINDDRVLVGTREGVDLNGYILEWAKQRFGSHYEITDWYKSYDLLSYLD
jgi:hypothetical protein